MKLPYRVPSLRGANVIRADGDSQTSADGQRRWTSRNVKRALANHRYDSVRVYTLKRREAGRWVVVDTGRGPEDAARFLKGGA